jgi:hypothetical protein
MTKTPARIIAIARPFILGEILGEDATS